MLRFCRLRVPRPAALLAASLLSLGAATAGGANSALPELGEHALLNIEEERKLGQSVYQRLLERGLIETHPLLDRYINDLGIRLLAGLDNPAREYRFFIVRDDAVNAFALPGGFIGINRGLIREARTQHQLASVMAHEIAHVRLRHGIDLMRKGRSVSNAAILGMIAGLLLGGVDSQVGAAVLYGSAAGGQQAMVNYTRENEYEADRLGVELMHAARFDANGMVEFFRIMAGLSGSSGVGTAEYLRTHPVNTNRIAEASARVGPVTPRVDQVDHYPLFRDFLEYVSSDHLPDHGSEYLRALALIKAGQHERADSLLAALYDRDSENIWYSIAYAENLELQQREAEAELVYRRLLDIFPGDYVLSMRLLRLLKLEGRNRSALLLARRLENEHPESKEVYFELAEIYAALGRPALRMMAEAEFHRLNGNPKQAVKLYDAILASGKADLATESKAREKRLLLLAK